MHDIFDETKHRIIIQTIFDEIILTKFTKKYHQLYSLQIQSSQVFKFQSLVFNTSDLICKIFQYLEFVVCYYMENTHRNAGDISNCS